MRKELTIQDVKSIEIGILDHINEVLKKNNIDYWLDGGTLLGCIRHKGFIPWDDDIDLIIRRKDYDRAIKALNEESKRYQVLTMYTQDDYYYPFAKVVDKQTRIKEKGIRDIENIGVFVDLFPLDTLPDDDKERKKFVNKIFRLRSIATYALYTKEQYQNADFIKKMKHFVGKIYGWKKAIKKVDMLCKDSSRNNNMYVVDIVAAWTKNREVDINVFDESINGEFEGKIYPIPKKYHEYLSALYGNYMELPPEEDRVLKHDFRAYKVL